MTLHTAKVRILGVQANITSVGGYNRLLSSGSAWGKDEDGNDECVADLTFGDSGGVGVSFHWTSKNSPMIATEWNALFIMETKFGSR